MIRYLLTALILLVPAFARADEREDLLKQLAEINAKLDALSLTYDSARAKAIETGKPLVVFVGTDSRHVHGAIECQVYSLGPDYPQQCVVVSLPKNGELYWHETLPPNATDAQIQQAMRPREVSQEASPFSSSSGRGHVGHDDSDLATGPWPKSLPFPEGMVRYRRARNTQEIAVTNGRDRISPVSRRNLERKWQVSGGMLNLVGWRSDVYRLASADARPWTWVDNIQVWNGSNFQPNRGYVRQYPDGAKFMDVLSTDGTVFEIREREKIKGYWQYTVAYEDAAARPGGYTSVRAKDCRACHLEAGSGGYGTGLVPGGDETISDPFLALE